MHVGGECDGSGRSELYMGLACCYKAREDWSAAQKTLEAMCDVPFLNKFDRARGANFLGWVLYAQGKERAKEIKDPRDPQRFDLLNRCENRVREPIRLTNGTYARALVNLYLTLSLQVQAEQDPKNRARKEAAAKRALEDGEAVARRKLASPRFENSTHLWFTLSMIYAYRDQEKDALAAFKKAREYETRDFMVTIWSKTEPPFKLKHLTDDFKKSLEAERKKSKFIQYLPATISVVWDEDFPPEQSAPVGEI